MIEIALASNNKKKIAELETMLSSINGGVRILSLRDVGFSGDIDEYGSSFEENSIIKASVPASLGYIGIADDSGLCVDYLNGAPGVYSARYAGDHGDDKSNRQKLLRELDGVPEEKRGAKFVCVASIVLPENSVYTIPDEFKPSEDTANAAGVSRIKTGLVRGECAGRILEQERGDGGFGYDVLFYSSDLEKSFGEASPEEKNGASHRGRAMSTLVRLIELLANSHE